MKHLPKEERPYEKCLIWGAERLSDAELIAVILRTGSKGVSALELSQETYSLRIKKGFLASTTCRFLIYRRSADSER